MRVRVLGSAAGGGLPQWNCGCPNCADARAGSAAVRARTQSSIALSGDGRRWALFNASPDLREQLGSFAALHPPPGGRGSGIGAVVLTDAEVDHTAGLLLLREGRRLSLHCTRFVRRALALSGCIGTLEAYLDLRWGELVPGAVAPLADADGESLGIVVEPFTVAGDPPLYWKAARLRDGGGDGVEASHTVGLRVTPGPRVAGPGAGGEGAAEGSGSEGAAESSGGEAALLYVPGAGAAPDDLLRRIGDRDVVLWDGTFWTDDELARHGVSERTAAQMGHLRVSGPAGSLERFRGVGARKVYVHVNNTNPILREDSPERRAVEAAGWEVAFDGMELEI